MTLNPNQHRSLSVELQHLERSVRDLRVRMRQSQPGILLTSSALPVEDRERLEPLLERILEEIGVLAARFELERREEDVRRLVQAEMSGAWEGLYDSLSGKLGRFGEVDPALAMTLDPHVQHLIALTDQVIRVSSESAC